MRKLLILCLAVILFSACSKSKDDASEYPYYFTGTIDGKKISWRANLMNTSEFHAGSLTESSSAGTQMDQYFFATIGKGFEENPSIQVGTLKYFDTWVHWPEYEDLEAMFRLGSFTYGKGVSAPETVDGAVVKYVDANGKEWSSEPGSQAGSTFSVTELTPIHTSGWDGRVVTIKFSCNLYDEGGNSIQVKDGIIRSIIIVM